MRFGGTTDIMVESLKAIYSDHILTKQLKVLTDQHFLGLLMHWVGKDI